MPNNGFENALVFCLIFLEKNWDVVRCALGELLLVQK